MQTAVDLNLVETDTQTEHEKMAKNLKNCLTYLKQESQDSHFKNTANILDIVMLVVDADLKCLNKN